MSSQPTPEQLEELRAQQLKAFEDAKAKTAELKAQAQITGQPQVLAPQLNPPPLGGVGVGVASAPVRGGSIISGSITPPPPPPVVRSFDEDFCSHTIVMVDVGDDTWVETRAVSAVYANASGSYVLLDCGVALSSSLTPREVMQMMADATNKAHGGS